MLIEITKEEFTTILSALTDGILLYKTDFPDNDFSKTFISKYSKTLEKLRKIKENGGG